MTRPYRKIDHQFVTKGYLLDQQIVTNKKIGSVYKKLDAKIDSLRLEVSDIKNDLEEKIADMSVSIIDSVQQMFDKQDVKIEVMLDAKINYRHSDDISGLNERVLILEGAH